MTNYLLYMEYIWSLEDSLIFLLEI